MSKHKKKFDYKNLKRFLPYFLISSLTLTIAILGSINKKNADIDLNLGTLVANDYKISVDQLSELYAVADLSSILGLASAEDVASNYVIANTMYDIGQTTSGKLEKPNIAIINISRGVLSYTVLEGENIDMIATKFGITSDQLRWSNNLKNTSVSPGTVLYVPSAAGIVYTVKSGDTIDEIVRKYGSSAPEIIALNDLEVSGISEGMKIVIKNGSLPLTERPEYVAPVRYAYTYRGDVFNRIGATCNYSLGAGQCVSWAQIKRPDLGIMGNANEWDDIARRNGRVVDNIPAAGAIFQTDSGYWGHVGYVESVNADGSINISERNHQSCYGVLYSTMSASDALKLNYIH